MVEMTFTGTACAKAILAGEHAVVHGSPAIAIPMPSLSLSVSVTRTRRPTIVVASDLKSGDDALLVLMVELALSQFFPALGHGLDLSVSSTIPVGGGLGSSAALSVALIRALQRLAGDAEGAESTNERAYALEMLAHGTPSGVDNTVVTHARPLVFRRGEPHRFVKIGGVFHFQLIDSGERSGTKAVVTRVRERVRERPVETRQLFAAIADLVSRLEPALGAGDCARVGEAMRENHDVLVALGVSTPRIDQLCQRCGDLGALGAKVTGAGAGGHILALWPEPPDLHALAGALRSFPGAVSRAPSILAPFRPDHVG